MHKHQQRVLMWARYEKRCYSVCKRFLDVHLLIYLGIHQQTTTGCPFFFLLLYSWHFITSIMSFEWNTVLFILLLFLGGYQLRGQTQSEVQVTRACNFGLVFHFWLGSSPARAKFLIVDDEWYNSPSWIMARFVPYLMKGREAMPNIYLQLGVWISSEDSRIAEI